MAQLGGSNNKCVRCSKTVYFVEQQTGPGGYYHKNCFTCKQCNKRLDSQNMTDNNNEAFCKSCYGRLFGPKGYGYGNTLSTETVVPIPAPKLPETTPMASSKSQSSEKLSSSKENISSSKENLAKFGATDKCPVCTKAVYFAEQALGPGNIKYHKMCFKCSTCSKLLDSNNLAEKENVLYCRPCHTKAFGPRGYGYGGAVSLG
ncbi:hypothetical protein HDV01_006477 [Terramyces sp. JEL0728]|nr:hypothetical protein HDV01_006477 [Terramyces sp. JEL0728]